MESYGQLEGSRAMVVKEKINGSDSRALVVTAKGNPWAMVDNFFVLKRINCVVESLNTT
jgi:hypothetical protein